MRKIKLYIKSNYTVISQRNKFSKRYSENIVEIVYFLTQYTTGKRSCI